jgi:hypothetical protein
MIKLIALLFSISTSTAGVRTVGNGGGFGEMKAHLALQSMSRQITLCLSIPVACQVTEAEKTLLVKVLRSIEIENKSGGLQFFNDPSLRETVRTNPFIGAPLFINSSLLTSPTGIAYGFDKISGYVLFGLLLHQNTGLSKNDLWSFSTRVFSQLRESIASVSFSVQTSVLRLHHMQVFSLQGQSVIFNGLLIEDNLKTYDLISATKLHEFCRSNETFSVQIKGKSAGPRSGDLIVPILWSCNAKDWGQAALYFHINLNIDGNVVWPPESSVGSVIRPPLN